MAPANSTDVGAMVLSGGNATLAQGAAHKAAAGWPPFNHQRDGKALLGQLDLAFLGAYACKAGRCGALGLEVAVVGAPRRADSLRGYAYMHSLLPAAQPTPCCSC